MVNKVIITFVSLIGFCAGNAQNLYLDTKVEVEKRVDDLIGKLSLEEKVNQLAMSTSAIPRLGIQSYDYWNEALHGVARSGRATIFPQAIGMAATFDSSLVYRIASAISDEARAKYNASILAGNYNRYSGLTFWSPNVNIFRDPRWGRGQETYGEDPYLTSLLGVSFVRGLQGDHPIYLKTAACAKHFAVHSGPEKSRHHFNAVASMKDLHETYLPAFKALVDSNVESVMCAYNRTNDEACCANEYLLSKVLYEKWEFKGHVVSDCWALVDFYSKKGHGLSGNRMEAAVLALENGVNLNCGNSYQELTKAVETGVISEKLIDKRLKPLLRTRFKLGMFDPKEMNPYNSISTEVIDCKEHRELAYEAAAKSIVLLKNNGVLPLRNNLNRYFIVGPNAASIDAMIGNYYGVNPNIVTYLEGITERASVSSQVQYSPGTTLDRKNVNPIDWSSSIASVSDATIMIMGLTRHIEGEEGESISSPYFGDRLDYDIPQNQLDYLIKIKGKHNKPIIAVITGGCPMNLVEVNKLADAVLLVWYPGEEGGNALADIIFGKLSPSGRLPVTFPKSLKQLPEYEDYNMTGRTYRYMKEEPMYPFGYGLSYTTFSYQDIKLSRRKIKEGKFTTVSCTITNIGQYSSDELVQLYISDDNASVDTPIFSLKGIKRIRLAPGESKEISFSIRTDMLELVNNNGESILEKGTFTIYLGGSLPSARSIELGSTKGLKTKLILK